MIIGDVIKCKKSWHDNVKSITIKVQYTVIKSDTSGFSIIEDNKNDFHFMNCEFDTWFEKTGLNIFDYNPDVPIYILRCTCGSDACGHPGHSWYCDKVLLDSLVK